MFGSFTDSPRKSGSSDTPAQVGKPATAESGFKFASTPLAATNTIIAGPLGRSSQDTGTILPFGSRSLFGEPQPTACNLAIRPLSSAAPGTTETGKPKLTSIVRDASEAPE
ncbi:hypothetical protein LTR86_009572 [Recurvomyces mirabilis]|nr:hypothetical protein LTR86_009572 [Recurvomyces mirabilis]